MAEEMPGLLRPSAINRVTHDLPRQDQPSARQQRRAQPRVMPVKRNPADGGSADDAPLPEGNADGGARVVGTRLNVRV